MSVTDVTSRIQQIQSQLAMLAAGPARPARPPSAARCRQVARDRRAPTAGRRDRRRPATTSSPRPRSTSASPTSGAAPTPQKGLDCSGLVQLVYKYLGYDLPRVSADQARAGRPVASMAEAQPGDLIAWDNSSRNNGVDHIAIYVGNGKMIEAPRTGLDVRLVDVPSTPDVIRRILPDAARGSAAAPRAAPAAAGHAVRRPVQRRPSAQVRRRRRACSPPSPSRSPATTRRPSAPPARRA